MRAYEMKIAAARNSGARRLYGFWERAARGWERFWPRGDSAARTESGTWDMEWEPPVGAYDGGEHGRR